MHAQPPHAPSASSPTPSPGGLAGPPAREVEARLAAAVRLAREAGATTLARFQRPGLVVDRKRDGTVVTQADRDAEMFLREAIAREFPDDAVLGEEFGEREGRSGYRWILDPIDGTASFVCGVPLYGTLVAVEHAGQAVAGVIEMPALGERCWGGVGFAAMHESGGTTRDARVSRVAEPKDAVLCTTALEYFTRAGQRDAWARIHDRFGVTRGWGDCYAFLLVATGRADVAIEPRLALWDIAAPAAVVSAAGGRVTDWAGVATLASGDAIVSNGMLHEAAIASVRNPAPR